MSIASEITRLNGAKADIIQAITDKGVTVPSSAKLDDMALLIASITGGGGGGGDTLRVARIDSVRGNFIVDDNGYIGLRLNDYFPHDGGTFLDNYAVVVSGADFSSAGLGQVTFLTPGTDSIGGRTYPTVNIGGKTWMAENLDLRTDGITIGTTGSPSTPAAWYYNNSAETYGEHGNKYGLLYNWYAVKHLIDNAATIIPGWHVPTTTEWDALATAVGGSGDAGTKLKSTTGWSSGNGDGSYGFAAFPAGNRNSGSFYKLGSRADFWTATENSSANAYYRSFDTGASMYSGSRNKSDFAFSVRLVKDSQ